MRRLLSNPHRRAWRAPGRVSIISRILRSASGMASNGPERNASAASFQASRPHRRPVTYAGRSIPVDHALDFRRNLFALEPSLLALQQVPESARIPSDPASGPGRSHSPSAATGVTLRSCSRRTYQSTLMPASSATSSPPQPRCPPRRAPPAGRPPAATGARGGTAGTRRWSAGSPGMWFPGAAWHCLSYDNTIPEQCCPHLK